MNKNKFIQWLEKEQKSLKEANLSSEWKSIIKAKHPNIKNDDLDNYCDVLDLIFKNGINNLLNQLQIETLKGKFD